MCVIRNKFMCNARIRISYLLCDIDCFILIIRISKLKNTSKKMMIYFDSPHFEAIPYIKNVTGYESKIIMSYNGKLTRVKYLLYYSFHSYIIEYNS